MKPTSVPAPHSEGSRSGAPLPPGPLLGFLVAVTAVVFISVLTYSSLEARTTAAQKVTRTVSVLQDLQAILSLTSDAESGQRGFLITGEESYLEPYTNAKSALTGQLASTRRALAADPGQQRNMATLEQLVNDKLTELARTIAMRRVGDTTAALTLVRSDRGRLLMESIRNLVTEMETTERVALTRREEDWQRSETLTSAVVFGGSALLLVLIGAGAYMTSRDYRNRQREAWMRAGQMGMSLVIQGEQRLETLGERALAFLAEYLGVRVGTLYIAQGSGSFRRVAGYALPSGSAPDVVRSGEGLLGQAAKENRPLQLAEVPDGYLSVASTLGRGEPQAVLVAPASIDGSIQGVLELGFFRSIRTEDQELLGRLSESLGVAVRASKDRTRLEELLKETQRQGEELQSQQEELRVSNEELEVQARSLKESQAQLESQQAELEQSNAQLEEQAHVLARQRDELATAQSVLAQKAADLERANQYKSEFLANMSHELRTPLNSSLILAKILADNRGGTLTAEQVKYAQTISSAGHDLLAIINDILDLSKIEAGKVELTPEPILVARVTEPLVKAFQPVAQSKGLTFGIEVAPGTPDRLETDVQRLGQILRNLLSNAFKFTERGEVRIRVDSGPDSSMRFAVTDTGIGMSEHQKGIIFDAFRQADGSTHRRYGGTGLGLTISRDLARLLGGDIEVTSEVGTGSTFTLTLPLAFSAPVTMPTAAASTAGVRPLTEALAAGSNGSEALRTPAPASASRPVSRQVEDDSERLKPDARLILIVEDDPAFATILRDLAHEQGFQCIVRYTGADALTAVSTYRPKAILLDMNLPDTSGLGVLDQLKRDPRMRHIPVHIVSVSDHSQEALAMGAIGYALKPARREQLIEALQRLEAKFSQDMRHVLVVEDDERQSESIRELLQNGAVQISAARNARDALEQLRSKTFDCVVMDLNLPDYSGYELLRQMAEHEEVAFPPVIVYTGRSMSSEEEQELRRFSRSIIIKDARSPERLLDEVTLFLHQVEATLPLERQRMLQAARDRDAALERRRILVVEDDVRNIFALSSLLEPKGASIEIARNGREAIEALTRSSLPGGSAIDLVLMDIMMPEMDGLTAMRVIRERPEWKKVPIIALTAKAMKDDHEKCLAAGANDYIAKPLDVEKLLSLVRVWMPK